MHIKNFKTLIQVISLSPLGFNDYISIFQGNGPGGVSHAKFTNYSFDVKEFLRLVEVCASYVRQRQDFRNFIEASTAKKSHEEL